MRRRHGARWEAARKLPLLYQHCQALPHVQQLTKRALLPMTMLLPLTWGWQRTSSCACVVLGFRLFKGVRV